MSTPGFVKLRTASSDTPLYLAVDQIASFVAYNRYRPSYLSWVTTKEGQRYQVIESTDQIVALIGMSFEAKFHRRCPGCDERIEPGNQVDFNPDNEVVHTHCDAQADADAPGRSERRCPDCFTIHAGGCL